MERKLHIGGTERVDGWEILDALERPEVDHVGNAKDLSQFANGTFAVVYASHVLEHFDYTEDLFLTLKEWHRVLEPGGTLYVSVPDIDILAGLLLEREKLSLQDRWQVMRMIFGGHTTPYDYHLVGLNQDFLVVLLRDAGFVDFSRTSHFGFFNDTSTTEFNGVAISCNVIARKAA